MTNQLQYVLFLLDNQEYIVPLAAVERVVRAVEITPLPQAPPGILGVINVHGRIVPVINLRRRLGLREQGLRLDDHLVIAQPGERLVAVVVDEVRGIMEPSTHSVVAAGELFPGTTHLEGAVKTEEG